MSVQPRTAYEIPKATHQVAQAALLQGNLYMRMCDELVEDVKNPEAPQSTGTATDGLYAYSGQYPSIGPLRRCRGDIAPRVA